MIITDLLLHYLEALRMLELTLRLPHWKIQASHWLLPFSGL